MKQLTLYQDFLAIGRGSFTSVLLLSYMYANSDKQFLYTFESQKSQDFYTVFMAEFNLSSHSIYGGLQYLKENAFIEEIIKLKKPYYRCSYQLNMNKINNQIAYNKEHQVKFKVRNRGKNSSLFSMKN